MRPRGCRTSISPRGWIARRIAWRGEDRGFGPSGWTGLRITRGRVGRAVSPPEQVAEVKAIACELPKSHELPLSRFSRVELHRLVIERGVTDASASTIWRWLHEDAIKPWQTRSWIFPRDPEFAAKAGRGLDLYARTFEGKRLRARTSTSSAPTRRPSCRRSAASIPPLRQDPAVRAWSSSSSSVVGRSRTWPPGTCTTPSCLTASSRPPGSSHSVGSLIRS